MKAKFLALAALVLGLASCQTDPQDLDVTSGGEQAVTINVALPEAVTRAAGSDSALGGINNVDMLVLVGSAILFWIVGWFFKNRTITRVEGGLLTACYVAYTAYLIAMQ